MNLVDWLPGWSHRYRWPLVGTALALSAAGAIAYSVCRASSRPCPC